MYGIKATSPSFRKVMGVFSGQRHDEMILLFVVDWHQVSVIKLTVNLEEAKELETYFTEYVA